MDMLATACRGGVRSSLVAAYLLSVFGVSAPLWSQGSADHLRRTIDVVVTDKAGNPVTGLAAGDFEVFENNAYHPIATALSPSFRQKETRFLAFIFDNVHFSLQASGFARQAALQMLDRAGPNMRVAVFWVGKTVRMIQPFSTDRAATRAAIELVTTPGQSEFHGTNESAWPKSALNTSLMQATEAASLDPLGTNGAGAVLVLSSVLNEWPGRKHAVIFSERPQDARIHLEHLNRVLRLANSARISVYVVQVQLVSSRGDESVATENRLSYLAENTGGLAFLGTNDYTDATAHVVGELSNYYELRWLPTGEWNGKRITARVKDPSLRVRCAPVFHNGFEKADALLTEQLELGGYAIDPALRLGVYRFWPIEGAKWLCSLHVQLPQDDLYLLFQVRSPSGEVVYRGTVHAEEPLPLAPGNYSLDAVTFSDSTHVVGGGRSSFSVSPLPAGPWISDVVPIRGRARPTLSANSVDDPLRLADFRLLPATDGRFERDAFVPFYLVMGGIGAPLRLNGDLLHDGKVISRMKLNAPTADEQGRFRQLTGIDMRGFAPGEYTLRLSGEANGQGLASELSFTLQ
jgi:VWFA-related protein